MPKRRLGNPMKVSVGHGSLHSHSQKRQMLFSLLGLHSKLQSFENKSSRIVISDQSILGFKSKS